ncbi:MAG: hypothetical protein H2057_00710 [Alphaproteobacteria bacterium]|nr:hypothetical protein [Alphaproteobacteria bacterium]
MMKKVFSGFLAVLSASTALAGNFYNADGLDDLKSGVALNRDHHMGLADNAYATLISPRLVVRATHGNLHVDQNGALFGTEDKEALSNDVLRFYGQEYRVTHWIEKPGGHNPRGDICIGVLDREVQGPICPVATHAGQVDDVYLHSLSRHVYLHTQGEGVFPEQFEQENRGSILYGRAFARRLYDEQHGGAGMISVGIPDQNRLLRQEDRPKDLFVPIGGDSSSPAYVQLLDGEYALLGLMSSVGDGGTSATYTDLGYNLGWLQGWEQRLIDGGVLPRDVDRIQTIASDQWQKNPAPFYEDLDQGFVNKVARTPHGFNPAVYLSLNPDLHQVFLRQGNRDATLAEAIERARRHYLNNGAGEGRPFIETVRIGAHPEDRDVPDDFDPLLYIGLNPGAQVRLGALTLREVLANRAAQDYQNHGGNYRTFISEEEARDVPQDFNALAYLSLNADLMRHFGEQPLSLALQSATRHYINSGRNEKRHYAEQEVARRLSGSYVDQELPKEFHPALYLARQPLLRDDLKDVQLKNLFQEVANAFWDRNQEEGLRILAESFSQHRAQLQQNPFAGQQVDETGLPLDFNPIVYVMLHLDLMQAYGAQPIEQLIESARNHYRQNAVNEGRAYREDVMLRRINAMPYISEEEQRQYAQLRDRFENAKRVVRTVRFNEMFSGLSLNETLAGVQHLGEQGYQFSNDIVTLLPHEEVVLDAYGIPLDFNPLAYIMINADLRDLLNGQINPANEDRDDLFAPPHRNPTLAEIITFARGHYSQHGHAQKRAYKEGDFRMLATLHGQPELADIVQAIMRVPGFLNAHMHQSIDAAFHDLGQEVRNPEDLNLQAPLPEGGIVVPGVEPLPLRRGPVVLNERGAGLPQDFDPAAYLRLNQDLRQAFGDNLEAARNHYLQSGFRENRRYRDEIVPVLPQDFDPAGYLRLNQDLRQAFGDNLEAARNHYLQSGFRENRRYREEIVPVLPQDFDPAAYLRLNQDIRQAFGDNLEAARNHYLQSGFRENRRYREEIVLVELPQGPLQQSGSSGEREAPQEEFSLLPRDFHVAVYLALNQDLLQFAQDNNYTVGEALEMMPNHYFDTGQYEPNRHYAPQNLVQRMREARLYPDLPEDFHPAFYLMRNPAIVDDIRDAPPLQLFELLAQHYRDHGRVQGLEYRAP